MARKFSTSYPKRYIDRAEEPPEKSPQRVFTANRQPLLSKMQISPNEIWKIFGNFEAKLSEGG